MSVQKFALCCLALLMLCPACAWRKKKTEKAPEQKTEKVKKEKTHKCYHHKHCNQPHHKAMAGTEKY